MYELRLSYIYIYIYIIFFFLRNEVPVCVIIVLHSFLLNEYFDKSIIGLHISFILSITYTK